MTIPGRTESAALLLSLDPPAWFLRHSRAVAEVAAWLAGRVERAGGTIDRRLVEAAGLLHDVDKLVPPGELESGLRHGERGADWLARRGYPELAGPVAAHPVTRLADEGWVARWLEHGPLEELVVAYADKRAGQRLGPLDVRFAEWRRRYPPRDRGGPPGAWDARTVELVWERARTLEGRVCRAAACRPEDVRRLRWTPAALTEARELVRRGAVA